MMSSFPKYYYYLQEPALLYNTTTCRRNALLNKITGRTKRKVEIHSNRHAKILFMCFYVLSERLPEKRGETGAQKRKKKHNNDIKCEQQMAQK